MNPDSDYGMSTVSCGNGKLRSWLIEQVETGKYAGLVWENDDKSIFRIPWKHAGKQDYNRDEDAALFKVGYCMVRGLKGMFPTFCIYALDVREMCRLLHL